MLSTLAPARGAQAQTNFDHQVISAQQPLPHPMWRDWAIPLHPRRITSPVHAAAVRAIADTDRAVLPRWGIASPIRHTPPPEHARRHHIAWWSRTHWLTVIVPATLALHPDTLAAHHVSPDTFTAWARTESWWATRRDGRDAIVRPDTVAALLECSTRTVQRCRAAARALGLLVDVVKGRMLTATECLVARHAGSPQRGLANVADFLVPVDIAATMGAGAGHGNLSAVDHVTPTRGTTPTHLLRQSLPCTSRSAARNNDAATRRRQHIRRKIASSPTYKLAQALHLRILWLRTAAPGRLLGQLKPYATAVIPWTSHQLCDAMDHINVNRGWTAPTKPHTSPFALLKWYLSQIDPVLDHPAGAQLITSALPRCTICGLTEDRCRYVAARTGANHQFQTDDNIPLM